MRYKINDRILEYFSEGEKYRGEDITLLDTAYDLTKEMPWHKDGLSIEKLFDEEQQRKFEQATYQLLTDLWRKAGLAVPEHFSLDQYHTLATHQALHLDAVDKTKLLPVERFPIDIRVIEERLSTLLHQPLKVHNPFDSEQIFHFRVVRPLSGDNNPLHRDVWLEDYKDCINLYIPVAGSNELSSLILARGSHLWPESHIERTRYGAIINGQKFNVPAVTNICTDVEFVRPNPHRGEILIFSPYLIHGGSVNLNTNTTRISIEIRMWKK